MAIYHMQVSVVSRGQGRSAVACAAYRAAEKINDRRLGKDFDFSRKQGVEHSEILAPAGSPEWINDRKELWNRAEAAEKRVNSRVAREVTVALPVELSNERQVALMRDFARENFTSQGMVADICIHRDNPDNPHAHVMLTTREVGEEGFGDKNRDWNAKNMLLGWRENWAHAVNLELAKEGHEQRIDHRSYAEQGINLEPSIKIGARVEEAHRDGREVVRDRLEEHLQIARRNGEAILEDPSIALDAITYNQATFSKRDAGKFLNTRTADAEQFQACLAKVMNSE